MCFFIFTFTQKFLHANIADPDLMTKMRSAASDLGLHFMPRSHLWDARHIWIKSLVVATFSCTVSLVQAVSCLIDLTGQTLAAVKISISLTARHQPKLCASSDFTIIIYIGGLVEAFSSLLNIHV